MRGVDEVETGKLARAAAVTYFGLERFGIGT
jgi:hypothetical protein